MIFSQAYFFLVHPLVRNSTNQSTLYHKGVDRLCFAGSTIFAILDPASAFFMSSASAILPARPNQRKSLLSCQSNAGNGALKNLTKFLKTASCSSCSQPQLCCCRLRYDLFNRKGHFSAAYFLSLRQGFSEQNCNTIGADRGLKKQAIA